MDLHLEQCPICGDDLQKAEIITEVVRGGNHTAMLKVKADVCLHCGERLYSMDTGKQFDEIRAHLIRADTADLKPIGQSFQIV